MARKKKFSAENTKPLPKLKIGLLMDDVEAESAVHFHVEEINKRLDCLCEHYETPPGDYLFLALALAEEFVCRKNPGRPKKWNYLALAVLNVEVSRILDDETLSGATVTSAVNHLATQERWQKFLEKTEGIGLEPDPASALKLRYYESRIDRKWAQVAWKAYKGYRLGDAIEEWERYIDDVLFGGHLQE
jgi:hypothetical protein